MLAVLNLFYNETHLFRYNPASVYTDAATVFGSNAFKYHELIYTGMLTVGWALILETQLASWYGVFTEYNLMVYGYGILFLGYTSILYQLLRLVFY